MKHSFFFTSGLVVVLSFFILSSAVFAQKESILFIGKNGKHTTLEQAEIMQKTYGKSSSVTSVESFKLIDAKWEKVYSEKFKKINDSTYRIKSSSDSKADMIYRIYSPNSNGTFSFKETSKGQTLRQGNSTTKIPLTLHGQVTEYFHDGQKKSISEYLNNELVSNQNWNESGKKYIDNIFYSTDIEPVFVPGIKVLRQHLLKAYKDAGIDITSISGSLTVGFVVMEDGRIDGLKIIKGLGPNINTVTLDSFSTLPGEWKPAILNNQSVRYFQLFPINFIYNEQKFEFAEIGKGGILHWGAY